MPDWTKTSAFEHFGISLTNVRWSWSGRSEDGKTVALVLWQDVIKGRDGQLVYDDTENPEADWRSRPGSLERTEYLAYCRDHLAGRFRAVIAIAADTEADPRQIARCFPQTGAMWQLDEFDENSGAFSAHVIR